MDCTDLKVSVRCTFIQYSGSVSNDVTRLCRYSPLSDKSCKPNFRNFNSKVIKQDVHP